MLLLTEDIELLCRELRDAKTQPDDVEQSREWITADYSREKFPVFILLRGAV